MTRTSLELAVQHILSHLTNERPLFVALQGPQGSGKSYLSAQLQSCLTSPPHSLHVAVLSIDDLYLPHHDLVRLSESENVLWNGRGQPGTHDISLGLDIMASLKSGSGRIELPRFDKSLFNGEGDRLPLDGTGPIVIQPPRLDVVILEGWLVGFQPITEGELHSRWNGLWKDERSKLGLGEDEMGRLSDIRDVNEKLKEYTRLWELFDVFIQLKPNPPASPDLSTYSIVYKWRLEQEHNMKSKNGGRGMSDADVKSFVDRYIPGYVFFGDVPSSSVDEGRLAGPPRWIGKALSLYLDEAREVTKTIPF